jgi:hypothetical protein
MVVANPGREWGIRRMGVIAWTGLSENELFGNAEIKVPTARSEQCRK